MALSNTRDNIKMYPRDEGGFVACLIRWNKSTRAWHVRSNEGSLHLHTGTVIPTSKGYHLINKVWDYDVNHPERINYSKVPLIKHTSHNSLTDALSAFALTLA